jgi:MEDS: MEthanogen/methylotroph, DcmR Sensory domain
MIESAETVLVGTRFVQGEFTVSGWLTDAPVGARAETGVLAVDRRLLERAEQLSGVTLTLEIADLSASRLAGIGDDLVASAMTLMHVMDRVEVAELVLADGSQVALHNAQRTEHAATPQHNPAARPWHRCVAYASDAERRVLVRSFLAAGAGKPELILYIGADIDAVSTLADVDRSVVDRSSRTEVVHLVGDRFDGPRALARVGRELQTVAEQDLVRLRIVADLTSFAAADRSLRGLVDFELLLDEAIVGKPIDALCVYNRRALGDIGAVAMSSTHSIRGGVRAAPYSVTARGDVLSVAGEVDVSSSDSLGVTLDALRRPVRQLNLDALGFLDVAGARTIAAWMCASAGRRHPLFVTNSSRLARTLLSMFDVGAAQFA